MIKIDKNENYMEIIGNEITIASEIGVLLNEFYERYGEFKYNELLHAVDELNKESNKIHKKSNKLSITINKNNKVKKYSANSKKELIQKIKLDKDIPNNIKSKIINDINKS